MSPPTLLPLSNVLFGFYGPHSTLFSQITLRAFKESINFSILAGYLRCEAAGAGDVDKRDSGEREVRATLVSPAPPDQSARGGGGCDWSDWLGVRCRLSAPDSTTRHLILSQLMTGRHWWGSTTITLSPEHDTHTVMNTINWLSCRQWPPWRRGWSLPGLATPTSA